jgi:hypothetical protein
MVPIQVPQLLVNESQAYSSARTDRALRPLDRAVEARDVVRALREYGFTQVTIGRAIGAAERSVRNWEKTSAIRPKNEERLQDLREIVLRLKDTLSPRGVGQWFRARNRVLGGRRPIEVLAGGNISAVREAAEAYLDGAYV